MPGMVGEEFPSRSFLLYWRANSVSAFGTCITLLALQTLVVLDLHGSVAQVGWLSSARWLPYLVVGVVVGRPAVVPGAPGDRHGVRHRRGGQRGGRDVLPAPAGGATAPAARTAPTRLP
jgi:hypothetical protein